MQHLLIKSRIYLYANAWILALIYGLWDLPYSEGLFIYDICMQLAALSDEQKPYLYKKKGGRDTLYHLNNMYRKGDLLYKAIKQDMIALNILIIKGCCSDEHHM